MSNALIAKLEQRDQLSEDERRVLEGAVGHIRQVRADEDIVREGDRPTDSTLLLEGFAGRYKILKDGRRQITAIHVVGDFVDLHSFLIKTMDHAVVALAPCKLALVPHESLRAITQNHPHLARLLWLSTLIDSAIHREWLVGMGRRVALGQMAHILCELFVRLQTVGQTEGNSFRFPLTQTELGDVLGLSTIHVNRTAMELREQGLITWQSRTVIIEDWERLKEVAEFEPTYLSLQPEPR